MHNTVTNDRELLLSMPLVRTTINEFPDLDIRKAFNFASSWAWFQQPGKTIFADRLYLEASNEGVDADLVDAAMRFLAVYGFVLSANKHKWVIRKPFPRDLVDAACIAVAREKLAEQTAAAQ